MRRFAVPGLVALLAVALVGLLVFGVLQTADDSSLKDSIVNGEKPLAHDTTLVQLDGGPTRRLADYRGGVVVVNFFASWCEPCEDEAPVLDRLQRRLEQKRSGTVIGVAVDDASGDTRRFVEDHGLAFPILRDVDRDLADGYKVTGLPETYVLDARGRIVAGQTGVLTQRWVDEQILPLLPAGSGGAPSQ
jgi:cytochrome c biogenesis protein CcmG/thiol:disulfide interchange protein DsbE